LQSNKLKHASAEADLFQKKHSDAQQSAILYAESAQKSQEELAVLKQSFANLQGEIDTLVRKHAAYTTLSEYGSHRFAVKSVIYLRPSKSDLCLTILTLHVIN